MNKDESHWLISPIRYVVMQWYDLSLQVDTPRIHPHLYSAPSVFSWYGNGGVKQRTGQAKLRLYNKGAMQRL
jgi:hypothetical protein